MKCFPSLSIWGPLGAVCFVLQASAVDLYVEVDAQPPHRSFTEAIDHAADVLRKEGVPAGGLTIHVAEGRYSFDRPLVLGPEFRGSEERPITIRAVAGAEVIFDGGTRIDPNGFARVADPDERERLSASAVDQVWVTTITDPALIDRFSRKLMLNLIYNDQVYLPAVFPNQGYALLKGEAVVPEACPPGVPVGEQDYGIRAANPPYQEPGKPQGWKGTLAEPRGAQVQIGRGGDGMAGTWGQWEREISRNNRRNQLTGFIEANWLLSSQPIYAVNAEAQTLHLSQALAYGWAWRKNDKQFRLFGLLCELDTPGEWHFDPLTNRLFLYPPEPMTPKSEIRLPVADGFLTLRDTTHVSIRGLSVQHVGSGSAYTIRGGSHNLIASCAIRRCTATGLDISGTHNGARGCDLVDLNRHVVLRGGKRSATEITPGNNRVENCHIYQRAFRHEKVNIVMEGVGNTFRHNLVHNSLGQAMTIEGNDHLMELNEFFNVGYDEGDGGAMYAGADLTGYGTTYRHNFFHHLMHVPGKVARSGIHLDDLQAGSICVGNLFYKSAEKGIFMNGGAGHTLRDNVFLEGSLGIYNVGAGAQRNHDRQEAIFADPDHMYHNTKENYVGRAEKIVGRKGWTQSPWREKYPLFYQVMSDIGPFGRMWPIRCTAENNFYYGNTRYNATEWSRVAPEAMAKIVITNDRTLTPEDFVDYENLDLRFKEDRPGLPPIPFQDIGLKLDDDRDTMPDKRHYRSRVKEFFHGIGSMPGTTKQIDTAAVVADGPKQTRP